jgi:uncharacterized membrane protein
MRIYIERFTKMLKSNIFLNIYILIGLLGILLSGYLLKIHLEYDPFVPCPIGGGCSHVLTGPYSTLFGIPIAGLGLLYYIMLIGISLLKKFFVNNIVNNLFYATIFGGVVFTIYLRILEVFYIGNWCSWCWLSVILIVLLVIVAVVEYKRHK